jgi:phage terminase Nu1 subunit (DNA packaging protein)
MIEPDTLVTDEELGGLLGVSARRIRQMAEAGTLQRVDRGRYILGPSIKAAIEEASGTGSALVRERTRKTRAEADRAELELAKARGEVALIADFVEVQEVVYSTLRANIMNVPQRVVVRLLGETNETAFKRVMRDELTEALKTTAETDEFNLDDDTEK